MSVVSTAARSLPRTSVFQLYSRHLPSVAIWATSLGAFFVWPYAYGKISVKLNNTDK